MNEENSYYESLVEQIKQIDTTNLSDDVSKDAQSKVVNKQMVYFWIRLFLKEEDSKVKPGDDIIIKWKPTGEELETKFIAYGKKGLDKDHEDTVTQYVNDDDPKILSLMIDTEMVNFNDDIPFIRTLFKTGYHYEYQLVKRNELVFIHKTEGYELDYYDCDF